ncbi:MAG TPA: hypothetical protein PKK69_04795 [Ferruginibacter sp.]|nr:hypothetical protein [Ferruginibacter sp.]
MKKILLFSTAALLMSGMAFANLDKGKKKKCAKGKTCCSKKSKSCCKKKEKTAEM